MKKKIVAGMLALSMVFSSQIGVSAAEPQSIEVTDSATGTTPSNLDTTFSGDGDNVWGLTITIPARMDLEYNETNNTYEKSDQFTIQGYIPYNFFVRVKALENITYTHETSNSTTADAIVYREDVYGRPIYDERPIWVTNSTSNISIDFSNGNKNVGSPSVVNGKLGIRLSAEQIKKYGKYNSVVDFDIDTFTAVRLNKDALEDLKCVVSADNTYGSYHLDVPQEILDTYFAQLYLSSNPIVSLRFDNNISLNTNVNYQQFLNDNNDKFEISSNSNTLTIEIKADYDDGSVFWKNLYFVIDNIDTILSFSEDLSNVNCTKVIWYGDESFF